MQALELDEQRVLLLLQFFDRVLVELRDTICVRCLVPIHRPPMFHDAGTVALQLMIFALPLYRPHAERLAGGSGTTSRNTLAAKKKQKHEKHLKKKK